MLSCKLLAISSRLSATGFQLKFLLSAYARVSGLGNRDWGASNRKPIARSRKPILGFGTGDSEAEKGDSGADSREPKAGSQKPGAGSQQPPHQPPRTPISFRYLLSAPFQSGSLLNPALSSELLSRRLFKGRTALVG